jgi:SAM-dependent methyltransferase
VQKAPASGAGVPMDLAELYRFRFPEAGLEQKARIWKALCEGFFQQFVPLHATVVDLACGYGEFINNIRCERRIGVDLNPDTKNFLRPGVEHLNSSATDVRLPSLSVDVVFTSNFFEHLPNKDTLDQVLAECKRILKPGGRLIVLGPNLKYVGQAYWDFYDHHLPLTDVSLREGLVQAGFEVERVVPRFLPYTTKSALPKHPALVSLYVKVPLIWNVLGKQFLAIAHRKMSDIEAVPTRHPNHMATASV